MVTGPKANPMLEAEAVIRNFGSRIKVVRVRIKHHLAEPHAHPRTASHHAEESKIVWSCSYMSHKACSTPKTTVVEHSPEFLRVFFMYVLKVRSKCFF